MEGHRVRERRKELEVDTERAVEDGKKQVEKKKRKLRLKQVKPVVLTEEEAQRETMVYAGKLLAQVPKRWLQESSVVKEAAGIADEPPLLDATTQQALDDMDRNTPLLTSSCVNQDMTVFLSGLNKKINELERKAKDIRSRTGITKPTLASSEAYLKIISKAPSGVEALTWLDEIEMTAPQWITPQHYELAFLHAVNPSAPVCERDILILWAKARSKDMLTPGIWAAMMSQLGYSSLRNAAFEFLYEALKQQYTPGGVPMEVCHGVFTHCKASNDPRRAIRVFLELTSAGCRIGLLSYLEIMSLLTRNVDLSNDQEVLDYMMECVVNEAERVIEAEGIMGIPRQFFSRALASCSAESAIRLWKFMQLHGVRVTYDDYVNFLEVMLSSEKLHEAQLIYRYLSHNHPDYLWQDNSRIPLLLLRVYLTKPGNESNAMSVFSDHFGPDSGAEPSKTAYTLMIRYAKDPLLVHNLYVEMLARGMSLDTDTYNRIFVAMGGSIKILTKKITYHYPVSGLDEELPTAVKEAQQEFATTPQEPLPPPQLGAYNPYSGAPHHGEFKNAPVPHRHKYGDSWTPPVEKRTGSFSVKEQALPTGFTNVDGVISEEAFAATRTMAKKRKAAVRAGKRSQSS
eukprot:TRINITY_DN16333_c0_g1_i2.p1 TRINITY_DN16333_c0_g1~~TRINITY_DN16333_c0_g1_i2.p1  ORF type:complete len:637 (+),score=180.74 TRINITY_DN16333_c0_g1_i2:30-1913(+)